MMILPFLGLIFWLESKVSRSNGVNDSSIEKELVQNNDEMNNLIFQQDEDNTISGVLSAHCACSFCGRLSNIVARCSRCKNASYCSNVCDGMHWRCWHQYQCVETEDAEDHEGSPSHGTGCLFMDQGNETSKYPSNDVDHEQKINEEHVYYIEGGEELHNNVEYFNDERAILPRHSSVSSNDGCAVCGSPSSKICSRCRAIKYW
ncbi:hypothetical protein RJT34_01708 [Clitoria ternatea]|uniref:MYND-type domain-containing protein n=1 Tax=Clitoria ternatea TaxID=43366 RepID=A0AAN9KGG8_CLITE